MVIKYPQLDFEQSWDGNNYSLNDGQECRGTISFSSLYCIGAFRNDKKRPISFIEFLKNTPDEIIKLAEAEALQYLLENLNGQPVPVVTYLFWGNESMLTVETNKLEEFGLGLIAPLIMNYNSAIEYWINYYDMDNNKIVLLEELFTEKVRDYNKRIILTHKHIHLLGDIYDSDICKSSFSEIGIEIR